MFSSCSSKKNASPIYEIPISNKFNTFEPILINETMRINRTPPPLPPRRRRFIRLESGELIPSRMHEKVNENNKYDYANVLEDNKLNYKKMFIPENNKEKEEIEPLFTVNISIKNERNGVISTRKVFL
jgi:hypothetical protein